MKLKDYLALACFILISLLAGFIGSFFTMDQIGSWYATLNRPSWTPPNWVFGPVWTTLYVLMGTAAYLVSRSKKLGKRTCCCTSWMPAIRKPSGRSRTNGV